jgi:phosphatidylserine/phosphatidylglycerophosphate/cardiolipin synthase-like enzyme
MEKFVSKKGVSVYAYQGDAMTLLAFDLDPTLLENFVGFTIQVQTEKRSFFLFNKIKFSPTINIGVELPQQSAELSTEFSPIQKFRWVHVPSTVHYIDEPYYGNYTYAVTPRYVVNKALSALDKTKTVKVTINVSPFKDGDIEVGFSRAFVSSQAFEYHFGNQLNLRPKGEDLLFDIKKKAGSAKRRVNGQLQLQDFSYEEIHNYLGWQARDRIMEFLQAVEDSSDLVLDVFAYDLNEPIICEKLLALGKQGRARIILDNIAAHTKPASYEMKFERAFKRIAPDKNIFRGHFGSQAHSKVFIQRKATGEAVKVLTGSTNFTTNGLYVNANHVVIFNRPEVAQLYADVFDASFGVAEMKAFKKSEYAITDYEFGDAQLADITIRFAPHPKEKTEEIFSGIENIILGAESDVLFAVMMDASQSSILDALRKQVESDNVFTYGISDTYDSADIFLYKPSSKRGVKVSGKKIKTRLPKPFKDIIGIPGFGHQIHHKFVVVDFKGSNPTAWVGSSNLAFNPEQKNGDNLIEIRDKDIVTAFAIEAIRLVDHFHWLNKTIEADDDNEEWFLSDATGSKKWYAPYYDPKHLKCLERTLLMR